MNNNKQKHMLDYKIKTLSLTLTLTLTLAGTCK